jgi:hypothetical protein
MGKFYVENRKLLLMVLYMIMKAVNRRKEQGWCESKGERG